MRKKTLKAATVPLKTRGERDQIPGYSQMQYNIKQIKQYNTKQNAVNIPHVAWLLLMEVMREKSWVLKYKEKHAKLNLFLPSVIDHL